MPPQQGPPDVFAPPPGCALPGSWALFLIGRSYAARCHESSPTLRSPSIPRGGQRNRPVEHWIASGNVIGVGHRNGLVWSVRLHLYGEQPVQPKALAPVATGLGVVVHSGCIVDAEPRVRKTSGVALAIKGEPVADGFAEDDCARPRRLLHESYRRDGGRKGLRTGQNVDSSVRCHEFRQVRCESGGLGVVAPAVESHIKNNTAGRMAA